MKNSKFSKICLKKIEIFQKFAWKNLNFFKNLPEKSNFFVILPEKIEISPKFAWKDRYFVDPDPRAPIFQTRLTPLPVIIPLVPYNQIKSDLRLLQEKITSDTDGMYSRNKEMQR